MGESTRRAFFGQVAALALVPLLKPATTDDLFVQCSGFQWNYCSYNQMPKAWNPADYDSTAPAQRRESPEHAQWEQISGFTNAGPLNESFLIPIAHFDNPKVCDVGTLPVFRRRRV